MTNKATEYQLNYDTDIIEWQTGINKAFGRMYFAIYSIDLHRGHYLEISTLDIFREHIPPTEKMQLLFDMVVKHYVSDGYKDGMRAFLNMDTLQERLSVQNAVSNEFFGTTQGWCRASLVVEKRDVNGLVERFAYVTQEINEEVKTEQERLAELKRAYAEVEMANQTKSDFLFQMSHDIRTPLNAIMGFDHLIEKCADQPEKVREYAAKIRVSGNLLLSLLNEILEMTKIEGGRSVLNIERFRMSELVRELEMVFRPQAEEKKLEFAVDVSALTHERFTGDKARISRVLLNILGNAMQYTPAGGRIAFSVCEEPQGDGGAKLIFRVADNGVGMTPEFQSRVFEEFTRDRSNVANLLPGAGLGLPIARSFTEMMGGTIGVESAPGKGSTFTVTIPLSVDPGLDARQESAEDDVEDILAGLHVLIVEDNDMNMEIITEILNMVGVKCDTAYSGQEAIEKVERSREGTYDLILMDICMPRMDGYETTRAIRGMNRPDTAKVPIVALTANAFEEDVRNASRAGMNGHLAKPLDMAALRETVKKLLK